MRISLSVLVAVSVIAMWSCGESPTKDDDTPEVTIGNLPQAAIEIPVTHKFRNQFTLVNADTLQTYVWQVSATHELPSGTYSIDQKGSFAFESAEIDSGITFDFRVRVLRDRTERAFHDFRVQIIAAEPVILHLVQRGEPATPNSSVDVSIVKVSGDLDSISLHLLFSYDPEVLTPISAQLGYDPYVCHWEYFGYSVYQYPQFLHPRANAAVAITAISDMNNGTTHPSCTSVDDGVELFRVSFKAVNDSSILCTTSPLQFIWLNCFSNTIYSGFDNFDTVLVGSVVMNHDWDGSYPLDRYRVSGSDCDSSYTPSLSGWCEKFTLDCKTATTADRVIFWNGQVRFECK